MLDRDISGLKRIEFVSAKDKIVAYTIDLTNAISKVDFSNLPDGIKVAEGGKFYPPNSILVVNDGDDNLLINIVSSELNYQQSKIPNEELENLSYFSVPKLIEVNLQLAYKRLVPSAKDIPKVIYKAFLLDYMKEIPIFYHGK